MLTHGFYTQLALALRDFGRLHLAIGRGAAEWDARPPVLRRDTGRLHAELFRKPIAASDVRFLDERGQASSAPTPRMELAARFEALEGEGPVRECGLLANGDDAASAVLLSYFAHPRVEKAAEGTLERRILLDLTPRPGGLSERVTRYLGNSYTEELHDLERATRACQLEEIRRDRRAHFGSIEEAEALGYDVCAHCFGRGASRR